MTKLASQVPNNSWNNDWDDLLAPSASGMFPDVAGAGQTLEFQNFELTPSELTTLFDFDPNTISHKTTGSSSKSAAIPPLDCPPFFIFFCKPLLRPSRTFLHLTPRPYNPQRTILPLIHLFLLRRKDSDYIWMVLILRLFFPPGPRAPGFRHQKSGMQRPMFGATQEKAENTEGMSPEYIS